MHISKQDVITLGFARRATKYKRPTLLFSNLDRLRSISQKGQIPSSIRRQSSPTRRSGQTTIRTNLHIRQTAQRRLYRKWYMSIAAKMVGGVDVWLNMPSAPWSFWYKRHESSSQWRHKLQRTRRWWVDWKTHRLVDWATKCWNLNRTPTARNRRP